MDQLTGQSIHDWVPIGRIRQAHGIKGEVFVALKAGRADWLDQLAVLALEKPGTCVRREFTVRAARAHKDGLILALEGIADRNFAEELRGSIASIPRNYLEAEAGERLFLGQLLGLEVVDFTLGRLGPIVGLASNGPQDLLVVETARGRFEIPLVDAFIRGIDLESGRLTMDLPPGLVEA